jgi:(2Fe-2S) ferredoxin
MQKPEHHIFVCGSFRGNGGQRGACHKKGSMNLLPYLEGELIDRGLAGVQISSCGCINVCERGPALIVYPENWWYGGIEGESDIDAVLDSIEDGAPDAAYLLT